MSIYNKLFKLQQAYGSQKTGYNKFGNYAFRNAEQMLKELKPLFNELGLIMVFKEEHLDNDYIKCVGTLIEVETGESYSTESTVLVDREAKGMQLPQSVGSAISYGRKYLLGGLLSITDSSSDPDAINTHGQDITLARDEEIRSWIANANDRESINNAFKALTDEEKKVYKSQFTKRRKELGIKNSTDK